MPTDSSAPHPRPARAPRPAVLRLALALAAVLMLVGGPTTATVESGWWRAGAEPAAAAVAPPGTAATAPGLPAPRDHRTADSSRVPRGELGGQIQALLDAQTTALLAGDEAGYLAPADPADPVLVADLRRRFAALRAMRVAGWEASITGVPTRVDTGTERQWRIGVRLGYCFAVAGCPPVPLLVETGWAVRGGTLRLVWVGTSPASELGPRPWEVTDLRVAVGRRVILAAPVRYAGRLPAALAGAERAAALADRYSLWAPPPGRYLVFLAGPDEWSRWYGLNQPAWVAGYAMPVADDTTEIILNGEKISGEEVLDTLRHEFAHVVSLAGVRRGHAQPWWLIEGIAEYVRMLGRPLSAYRGLTPTRQYVLSGHWSGEIALGEPPLGASPEEASGRYGVAFLAVRRLAQRFGEAQMLAYFDAVVRHGADQDAEALARFGVPLTELTEDCVRYLRATLA